MNSVNMAGMNPMGGVGVGAGGGATGVPLMNNGMPTGARQAMPSDTQRGVLNTYIYEYFIRSEMFDCAHSLVASGQPLNLNKNSPNRRRDESASLLGNGVSDDAMDQDSKDGLNAKRREDLPAPNLPGDSHDSCFLFDWWCLFWDMWEAQRGRSNQRNVTQYVQHTQNQSRMRQDQHVAMLQQMRPNMMPAAQYQLMMRNQQNAIGAMNQNELARKAMTNNRNATPAQMQMMQQQKQQMAREGSDMDGNRQARPQSPSGENAGSPSKRPRMDNGQFNGPQGMMPNGRGPAGMPGQQMPAGFPAAPNPATANKSIQNYASNLLAHQQNQMPNKAMQGGGTPQGQASPMMPPGQDNGAIANFYNTGAGEMGPNGMRGAPNGQPGTGGNHALQDYQMQLMLLEQQNKKRLMMARQEQDSMAIRDVPTGPNGQPDPRFGASPQGPRTGSSPNPADQMKRGTPQMNAAGIPSPLPEGQNRGSPGTMNFVPGQMDPNMAAHMNGAMMPNGLRPPGAHPGPFAQMGQQQMMARLSLQQPGQAPPAPGQPGPQPGAVPMAGWQPGPNGTPMLQQPSQGPTPQSMGTPQQRPMPPPQGPPGSAVAAAAAAANGRATSSPQQNPAAPPTPSQTNKANPKKKNDVKDRKRPAKKPSTANISSSATPSADGGEPATPTPATPINSVHPNSFKGPANGAGQPAAGQTPAQSAAATAPSAPAEVPQPDPSQAPGYGLDDQNVYTGMNMDFANPGMGNDVLADFDFDSFLHSGDGVDSFSFEGQFLDGNEVGAE